MSSSFRFETYENVIAKHTLSKTSWSQVAQYAFNQNLHKRDYTIAGVRMIDADTGNRGETARCDRPARAARRQRRS